MLCRNKKRGETALSEARESSGSPYKGFSFAKASKQAVLAKILLSFLCRPAAACQQSHRDLLQVGEKSPVIALAMTKPQ